VGGDELSIERAAAIPPPKGLWVNER